MKLFYTPIDNLVQKVEVVAAEIGLWDRITVRYTRPFDREPDLVAVNPLGRVPTLVLDDGTLLYGGPVIYEYMDTLNTGQKLFPPVGPQRWRALRLLTLGDGLWEILTIRQQEVFRPIVERSPTWIANYDATVKRALDGMEREAPTFTGFDIGHISCACALSYVDKLRAWSFSEVAWRDDRPVLAAWYAEVEKRPTFRPRPKPAS